MRRRNWAYLVLGTCASLACSVSAARADVSPPTPQPTALAQPSAEQPVEVQPLDTTFQLEPLFKARYYFQANLGRARSEYRVTFGRNDERHHNQYEIRVPLITAFTPNAPPKTGLGQVSLFASHVNAGAGYSRSLAGELFLPTVTNGVRSNDTQVRAIYALRWKGRHQRSFTLENTYAQSIFVPPGSSWTSYYDVKLAAAPYVGHGTFAVFYEGRSLFTRGGTYASSIGPNLVAQLWRGATLSAYDIWGIGASGQTNLWRYKVQANLTVRL